MNILQILKNIFCCFSSSELPPEQEPILSAHAPTSTIKTMAESNFHEDEGTGYNPPSAAIYSSSSYTQSQNAFHLAENTQASAPRAMSPQKQETPDILEIVIDASGAEGTPPKTLHAHSAPSSPGFSMGFQTPEKNVNPSSANSTYSSPGFSQGLQTPEKSINPSKSNSAYSSPGLSTRSAM